VASWHLVVNLVGHHLIPCLLASAVIYIALGLLFRLGRLRRPADRAAFLYIALLKAGLALWAGARLMSFAGNGYRLAHLGLRLPDLVPDGMDLGLRGPAGIPPGSELAGCMLLVILSVALVLLCCRWIRLAPVYRVVYRRRRVGLAAFPEVCRAFERLVARAYRRRGWLREPELMIVRDAGCLAFVMGVRSPVVVLSTGLVARLADREVEAILAHEVAHVRRQDHLGRWMATVLRDVMAWNPFVAVWYERLVEEQEMACDEYAAAVLGDPVAVASALVEVAAFPQQGRLCRTAGVTAWRAGGRRSAERLNQRLDRLGQAMHGAVRPSRWRMLALVLLLAAFVAAQPHAAVSLPNIGAILTRMF